MKAILLLPKPEIPVQPPRPSGPFFVRPEFLIEAERLRQLREIHARWVQAARMT